MNSTGNKRRLIGSLIEGNTKKYRKYKKGEWRYYIVTGSTEIEKESYIPMSFSISHYIIFSTL